MMEPATLESLLPPREEATADRLLEAFLEHAATRGLELYPAQEEALLEVLAGNSVILNTPTGSGKSLVAAAAHFRALARGERCFYTAPIKALVSEKFFALCREFGAENVGMMTGDASVNRDAPIVCCTAEILANIALREGERAEVDHVTMDEFHYYADRDRGWAWQVPLLTLPQTTFLLMSATLGDTTFFEDVVGRLTGRPVALVKSEVRPVPLDFEYRETPLHETIGDLLESRRVPVYIVHFTQRAAAERAQSLMSVDFLSKAQKQAIKDALSGFRFDTPFGQQLKRFVSHGVGVHHAGMLPKYRLVVEKLAQDGLLRIICGTDTLGVGVNIPIRTVLFTQLCKYDGEKTRILGVRDFKQIAGRAGRKGFDDRGSVVVQAPEHAIENRILEQKTGGDAKKVRKLVRKKPPDRGYAHWDRQTFDRLIASEPETLSSSFQISHGMLLQMLERPGDGCRAIRALIRGCHDGPKQKRSHGRTAIAMFRSLRNAGIVEILPEPDADGRRVRVNVDLQEDFSLNQTLSLYAVEAIETLDPEDGAYAPDVLTMVEAVLEDPAAVIAKQIDKRKGELVAALKAEGVEYEQRMKELERVEAPKPRADFIYATFDVFSEHHPWVGTENVRPKSVAREMWEEGMGFKAYVNDYGLARAEGVLLRYLSDTYKAMIQNVPESRKTDEVYDLTDWLGAVVRQVDSSLIDEWERLSDVSRLADPSAIEPVEPAIADVTADEKLFTILVRNELFGLVRHLSRRAYHAAAAMVEAPDGEPQWTGERLAELLAPYWDEHGEIRTDPDARSPRRTQIARAPDAWEVVQILADPEGHDEWHARVRIPLARSRDEQRPVLVLESIGT
jgi:superfamily II RNA helicase